MQIDILTLKLKRVLESEKGPSDSGLLKASSNFSDAESDGHSKWQHFENRAHKELVYFREDIKSLKVHTLYACYNISCKSSAWA